MNPRPTLKDMRSLRPAAASSILRVREASEEKFPVAEELPPVAVMDEVVDAEIGDLFEPEMISPPTPVAALDFVAELTANDKIEAVCVKIDSGVRMFIEEELRGRFVAVQVLKK